MGRTLLLQTPLMRGADVKYMQRVLGGENVWKKNFHPGPVDGEYGEQSASATYRAKYYLGYPRKLLSKKASDSLRAYLSGERKLPASFAWRKKRRLSKKNTLGVKALRRMKSRNGLAEYPPGSNKNWLVKWWYNSSNIAAAWCAIDVSESYIFAGSKVFSRGNRWAYVPYMEQDASRGDRGLMRIGKDSVRPGDIVTYAWDSKGVGRGQHVGEFIKWIDSGKTRFLAEEGNTDSAGGAEGGQQLEKARGIGEVNLWIRVQR